MKGKRQPEFQTGKQFHRPLTNIYFFFLIFNLFVFKKKKKKERGYGATRRAKRSKNAC